MRTNVPCWILLALLVATALSGCLDQGDAETQATDDDEGDPKQGQGEGPGGNETDDPGDDGGNETGEQESGSGDGNETQEDDGDEGEEEGDNETAVYDPGWPEASAASIRPGVKIAGGCTSNFVFSSPDNRTLYMGTASHCVSGSSLGDPVDIAGLPGAGRLAYCSWMYTEEADYCPGEDTEFLLSGNDFALVEIDGVHRDDVHPSMIYWGGPLGLGPTPGLAQKVHVYGNSGTKPFEDLRIMEGYVARTGSETWGIYSLPPGIPGDSGSAVITSDGDAVGIFVGIGVTGGLPGEGVVSDLGNALGFMQENSGLEVELKTWDLEGTALLPG